MIFAETDMQPGFYPLGEVCASYSHVRKSTIYLLTAIANDYSTRVGQLLSLSSAPRETGFGDAVSCRFSTAKSKTDVAQKETQ